MTPSSKFKKNSVIHSYNPTLKTKTRKEEKKKEKKQRGKDWFSALEPIRLRRVKNIRHLFALYWLQHSKHWS